MGEAPDTGSDMSVPILPPPIYARICSFIADSVSHVQLLLLSKRIHQELTGNVSFWRAVCEGLKPVENPFGKIGNWNAPWHITVDFALACEHCKSDDMRMERTVLEWRELANSLAAAKQLYHLLCESAFFRNESWTFSHLGYWEPRPFAFFSDVDLNEAFTALMPSQNIFDGEDPGADGEGFVGWSYEGGIDEFSRDCMEDDDDEPVDYQGKEEAMASFLQSRWPNARVWYGSGNGTNWATYLVDVLWVRRGNSVGGVLIYRNW